MDPFALLLRWMALIALGVGSAFLLVALYRLPLADKVAYSMIAVFTGLGLLAVVLVSMDPWRDVVWYP